MGYLLAHDVGTSGCKAVLADEMGKVVVKAFENYPTYYPQPLFAEQEVEDWWRAVVNTTRQVMEISGARPKDILALSFSSQMLNTIPVDSIGVPLRRCISWLDGRAWEQAAQVMRKLGGKELFNWVLGSVVTGKDLLAKYLWLKQNEPDIYRRSAAFMDCGSYLLQRTTGRLVCEWGVASVTGLFNLKGKTWETTFIRLFGLDPAKFPELVRSIDQVGGLKAAPAADLGLLEGTPVYGGGGDAMCTAVGSGAVGEGEAHLTLGTSGYVAVLTSRHITGRQGTFTLQPADPTKLMLIAESETVGACLKWVARELYGTEPGEEVYARMDAEVAGSDVGSGSLIFTPWMYGERCPVPDESVRAAFINLGANHTRQQMARAVYEGVAYNFRWILDLIKGRHGFPCPTLRVVGGGARGLPWLRILADVTGRQFEKTPHDQDAAAVGAALIAAIGVGIHAGFEAVKPLVPAIQTFQPDPVNQAAYEQYYRAYRKIYPALKGLYHELNRAG